MSSRAEASGSDLLTVVSTHHPVKCLAHVRHSTNIFEFHDSGRDWGQEEKGMTEDEMAGWHHQLDGYKFE